MDDEILARYKDIEWDDDITEYQCSRCGRVLIQHYIANCEHKFCANCKGVLGDGSARWKCPSCHQFIRDIERQDFEFRDKVFKLRVHCPNQKYGCECSCSINELKVHLKCCKHTRESALPVLYQGVTTPDNLEQFLELRREMKEMKQKMMETEERQANRELAQEMKLADLNNEISELKKKLATQKNVSVDEDVSLAVKKMASKILKLEVKSEILMDMSEKKDKNIQTELQNLKIQIETQVENKNEFQDLIKVVELEVQNNKADLSKQIEKIKKLDEEMKRKETLMDWKLNEQILQMNEKMEDHVSGLNVKLIKVGEDVVRISNLEKSEFDNNVSNEQDTCNITDSSHLFNLSSDTLAHTLRNLDVSNVVKKEYKLCESAVFSLQKHGINAQMKIEITSVGSVTSSLRFLKKQSLFTKTIKMGLFPRITYVMKIEKNRKIKSTYTYSYDFNLFSNSLTFDTYDYGRNFNYFRDKPEPKFEVGENFSMEVHIDTPEMSNQFYSDNGRVTGAIWPFGKIKEWASKSFLESINSPYFYTSPKGYRALITFAFTNENSQLLTNFRILSGAYDSLLKETKFRVSLTLINQRSPSKSVTHVKESSVPFFYLSFPLSSNLSDFVMNDQLIYEASVDIN